MACGEVQHWSRSDAGTCGRNNDGVYLLLLLGFLDFEIRPSNVRGMLNEFLTSGVGGVVRATLGFTLTLANASRSIGVLNMTKEWCQLLRELNVVGYLLRQGS